MSVVIIDYGLGNLGSISNMLKKIGAEAKISSKEADIFNAKKLVLPGVGSFDSAIKNIRDLGLGELLNEMVLVRKTPILGICLGMHLLTNGSEEGVMSGFGWINAETIRFRFVEGKKIKIPHMGWNSLKVNQYSPILTGINVDHRFYFVHSYHVAGCCNEDMLATTFYGYDFVSAIQKENIIGVQFHPEKSHKYGLMIFKNFLELI